MIELKNGVQVIHLQPDDKILVIYDPNFVDVEQAQCMHRAIRDFFNSNDILGVSGTEFKIIRKEKIENAEDNFKEHFPSPWKDTQA